MSQIQVFDPGAFNRECHAWLDQGVRLAEAQAQAQAQVQARMMRNNASNATMNTNMHGRVQVAALWRNIKSWVFAHVFESSFEHAIPRISQETAERICAYAPSLATDLSATQAGEWTDLTSMWLQREERYEFDLLRVIGSGAFGTVFLSSLHTHPERLFALKVVPKYKIRKQHRDEDARRLETEKNVLCAVDHPFITKLYCAFETQQNINFVMEYCAGGDMYFLLEEFPRNRLPETHVLFYAASLVSALDHLHQRGILYRDLKPENILLDDRGFVRLADFGFARDNVLFKDHPCKTCCGSIEYVAPEVLGGNGYGAPADLWSLGCVLYELLAGTPPFYCANDRAVLFSKIKHEEPSIPGEWSDATQALVRGLLQKDASHRLGCGPNGMRELYAHPAFAAIDWYELLAKQTPPPYVPKLGHPLDTSHFEAEFTSQQVAGTAVYETRAASGRTDGCRIFTNFDWCSEADVFM